MEAKTIKNIFKISRLILTEKLSVNEIAEKMNMSRRSVSKYLNEYMITYYKEVNSDYKEVCIEVKSKFDTNIEEIKNSFKIKEATEEKLISIVDFTIKNEPKISIICSEFNVSRRTAQEYINEKLLAYAKNINPEYLIKYYQIRKIMKNNQEMSQFEKVYDINPDDLAELKIRFNYTNEMLSNLLLVSETFIAETLKKISIDYKKLVENQNQFNKKYGQYAGGKNKSETMKLSDDKVIEIAKNILKNGWTIEEASENFSIPVCVICSRLKEVEYYVPGLELCTEVIKKNKYVKTSK